MKKAFLNAFLLSILLLFSPSCTKYDSELKNRPLSINGKEIVFESSGGDTTFLKGGYKESLKALFIVVIGTSVTRDQPSGLVITNSWCRVTDNSDGSTKIEVERNDSGTERSCTINYSDSDGARFGVVTVRQKAAD